MPPDITPGGGTTPKDVIPEQITDRETNIATLNRVMNYVQAESTHFTGRPDSSLRLSTAPGTYWTLQVEKNLLNFGSDTSITAVLNPDLDDGLPAFESIRADVLQMFGTRVGGIHLHPRTGERGWDENEDVSKLAQLVDEYSLQKEVTEKVVRVAAEIARAELRGMTGAHNDRWAIEVKPDENYVTIWELDDKETARLIIASPAVEESEDGTPARPAKITVQDLRKGTIVNLGRTPIRDLGEALDSIFPDRADIHARINNSPEDIYE